MILFTRFRKFCIYCLTDEKALSHVIVYPRARTKWATQRYDLYIGKEFNNYICHIHNDLIGVIPR